MHKTVIDGVTRYYSDETKKDLHREDGPALTWDDGDMEWYLNGERHRTDGPAVDWSISREWWVDGLRHREDGPAVVDVNVITNEEVPRQWWLKGVKYDFEGWLNELTKEKDKGYAMLMKLKWVNK